MQPLRKIEVTTGVWWVEAPDAGLRILCGCPADVVKHLMKRGLIATQERNGVAFEGGPNAILLSDVMVQNGSFANLGEFPVLQMLYRQGMLLPGHPGNTGVKPLLIGSAEQVRAQMQYIHRGNYGLISEAEMMEAGATPERARELMRLKLKFAFGKIRQPTELLDTRVVDKDKTELRGGVSIRRLRLNVFEFRLGEASVTVDLNLSPSETYQCPYPLSSYKTPREYFAVVHSGEGDGWDINRPSMGTVLMFQGRIYLIDAGPNILFTLDALGIGVNEIDGIFHTHSHDDHFSGLTTLIRADHCIDYYATPLVRASVARKLAALLDIDPSAFTDYFTCHDLVEGKWNDIDGLEVLPMFSPHPVETTIFQFRALWEGGYRTYAHLADICRLEVLRGFITADADAPGISAEMYQSIAADYARPADLKKVDVGGGMIHGDAEDFRDDASGKVILAHTSLALTQEQRGIGSDAGFGTLDVLIPSNHDFIWRYAYDLLRCYFPEIPHHQVRALLNNPIKTFNPGAVLAKEGRSVEHILLLLSGSVETLRQQDGARSVLSAGAMIGELAALFGTPVSETYRAVGYVRTLELSCSLYEALVRRNGLEGQIARAFENREFLQRTRLFGEVVSARTLNQIAREMERQSLAAGQLAEIAPDSVALIISGKVGRFLGEHLVEELSSGDFFGEEMSVFWTPSVFRLVATDETEIFLVPARLLASIPSVRWKLFESSGRRMLSAFDNGQSGRELLSWREEYRVNVLRVDTQHRRLFEQANAIMEAVEAERDDAEILRLLEAMTEYARYHFGDEEALLVQNEYPESEIHRNHHAVLIDQLQDLRTRITDGHRPAGTELLPFLRDWLVNHILSEDRRYSIYLNGRGVM